MNYLDVEIREITTCEVPFYRVAIYNLAQMEDGLEVRNIRELYSASTYEEAISQLPYYLGATPSKNPALPPREPLESITAASTLEFVELCHDVSNTPDKNHQLWLNELTIRCRQYLRKLLD
jgi:hypothetical protein